MPSGDARALGVETGTPPGDDSDLPAVPVLADGWQTGLPDLVMGPDGGR